MSKDQEVMTPLVGRCNCRKRMQRMLNLIVVAEFSNIFSPSALPTVKITYLLESVVVKTNNVAN